MRRLHLVELEDLPWFPRAIRDGATNYLAWITKRGNQIESFVPALEKLLRRTGERELVDLCSGGSGPTPDVVSLLRARGLDVRATLTDFYPNIDAFRSVCAESGGALSYSEKSVDATAVPESLPGARTIWNAFHHFRPEQARQILGAAVRARQPIAVLEILSREPLFLLSLLFSPVVAVLTAPFWRPFRWSTLFFSWVVPVIPFVIVFDGVVSWLRIYSEPELRELVTPFGDYDWEIGKVRLGGPPVHGTYLIGSPR